MPDTLSGMRKLGLLLALLAAGAAVAGSLYPSGTKEFTDCDSGGSAAQTLTRGNRYLMRVFDADVWVCFAASGSTCASGGERFGPGFAMKFEVNGDLKSVSCRSSASTGDVIFTPAD